jgi:hypothetical protein
MSPLSFRRLLWRSLVALLILAVQSLLPALANASLPDPSWIPGIYDDADDDDVALLVSSGAGTVAPDMSDSLRPPPPVVGKLGPAPGSGPQALRALALHSRAPPAR